MSQSRPGMNATARSCDFSVMSCTLTRIPRKWEIPYYSVCIVVGSYHEGRGGRKCAISGVKATPTASLPPPGSRVGIHGCRNSIYDRKIYDSVVDLLMKLAQFWYFGHVSKSLVAKSTTAMNPNRELKVLWWHVRWAAECKRVASGLLQYSTPNFPLPKNPPLPVAPSSFSLL